MSSYFLTFASTHAALACEKACNDLNEKGSLVPIPSGIRAGCGMGLLVYGGSDEEVLSFAYALREEAKVGNLLEEVYAKTENDFHALHLQ